MPEITMEELPLKLKEMGQNARSQLGESDVRLFRNLKNCARLAEIVGRIGLYAAEGPWIWFAGLASLSFYLSLESQLNHSVMHGAYLGLPGAENLTRDRYETLAVPFQSKTWGDAHRIHHANPSLLGSDPDSVHPLFRVHEGQPWRPWHHLNTFLGAILVFECWAFDYDQFLKRSGHRPQKDRGEIKKFMIFLGYQHVLFPILAGPRWKQVLIGTLLASIIRNFVFTGLQTASSVGNEVSTRHPRAFGKKSQVEWFRFQIETSKNFVLKGYWKVICGGLDRHIEHHLYPSLPPNRLHALSGEVRELCQRHGVNYVEYPSFRASLRDSLSYLWKLSRRPGGRA